MLAKAPNRKRATEYLHASGAVPITIIERDGGCSISTGRCLVKSPDTVSTWWTAAPDAARIASRARQCAGPAPDLGRPAGNPDPGRHRNLPGERSRHPARCDD